MEIIQSLTQSLRPRIVRWSCKVLYNICGVTRFGSTSKMTSIIFGSLLIVTKMIARLTSHDGFLCSCKHSEIMSVDNGYHKKATGKALSTAQAHENKHPFTFYGACFCPFVHRAWIHLELAGIDYQYVEVDPYAKPKELTDINPKGLVPSLRHGDWGSYESSVIMEYIEDLQPTLFKGLSAQQKADQRLWVHFVNGNIVPAFYRLLQAQEEEKQVEHAKEFQSHLETLVNQMDKDGPFFCGSELSLVDVAVAPWIVRIQKVLKPYRGFEPEVAGRWGKFYTAILNHPTVAATTSTDDLYLDSYKRYAENRPNTSQVANAINSGRALP